MIKKTKNIISISNNNIRHKKLKLMIIMKENIIQILLMKVQMKKI